MIFKESREKFIPVVRKFWDFSLPPQQIVNCENFKIESLFEIDTKRKQKLFLLFRDLKRDCRILWCWKFKS